MQDFRSGHFAKDKTGHERIDHTPMREDIKDDYIVDLARGLINSHIGLPLLGVILMGISYLNRDALYLLITFSARYGNHISKEMILPLYGLLSAAPSCVGALALYKGMINLTKRILSK